MVVLPLPARFALHVSELSRRAPAVDTLLRDGSMLLRQLRGVPAPPLVQRGPSRSWTTSRSGVRPRPLQVARVVRETPDAVSLYLAEPDGRRLSFLPGQFLTLQVEVEGERLRRAYSIASPAIDSAPPHITVKRVDGGSVSNYLNDQVDEGDLLHVLGPSGSFTVKPDPSARRDLVMIAGGSGITPLISIAHSVLAVEQESRVTLIYGNRSVTDVIFRERLDHLAMLHRDRLSVDHVLQEPPEGWIGGVGLLDASTLQSRLSRIDPPDHSGREYLICGPTPMMEAARAVLEENGVDAARIREERFTRPEERAAATASPDPQPLTVRHGSASTATVVVPGQTLLEAGLAAGAPLRFSCAMGGCGSCRVRLTAGEVAQDEPSCLTQAERDEGYVLACVSRPRGPVTVEAAG